MDHLSRSNLIYLAALSEAADKGRMAGRARRDRLDAGPFGRWIIGQIGPPPRFRLRAPLRAMLPASHLEKEPLLAEFSRCQRQVEELLRESSDLDLSRIRFRNPMVKHLPLFNLATGFLVIAAHERRHLLQARRVLAASGFPV